MMKASYYTLGCKVNKYETDAMQEILEARGFETVEFGQQTDFCIINTCTVTAMADKKSRQIVSRACSEASHVIVCGCMTQHTQDVLQKDNVDAVMGSNGKNHIYGIVDRILAGERKINAVEEFSREEPYEELSVSRTHERTRANIKICDGCDMFCTYCIIPYVRGRVRSRRQEEIVKEAEILAGTGVKEIILTGIHVSSYGKDLGDTSFIDILELLQNVDGIERIRLSSLEPGILTEDFCSRASRLTKLCPHFHISLQNGSDTVLKRMNRKYDTNGYRHGVELLRKYFDRPAITTDVICGFPGETEKEFEENKAFLREIGFSRLHVFPYSPREGTVAACMPDQITNAVKKLRTNEVIELGKMMSDEYALSLAGTDHRVLLETKKGKGICEGYIERYLSLDVKGDPGEIKTITITGLKDGRIEYILKQEE